MSKLTAVWSGDFRNYENIPTPTLKAIIAYVIDGRRGGDFLNAVMSNDLMGAYAHGELPNLGALWAITTFVYNRIPRDCWGSPEKVQKWVGLRKHMAQVMSSGDVEKVVSDWLVDATRDIAL